MANTAHKEHYNLYYIFAADKKEHPMPEHKVDAIRGAIFSHAPPKNRIPSRKHKPSAPVANSHSVLSWNA